jgi:chromosome segregation ATPase
MPNLEKQMETVEKVVSEIEKRKTEIEDLLSVLIWKAAEGTELHDGEIWQAAEWTRELGRNPKSLEADMKLCQKFRQLESATTGFERRSKEYLEKIADLKADRDEYEQNRRTAEKEIARLHHEFMSFNRNRAEYEQLSEARPDLFFGRAFSE